MIVIGIDPGLTGAIAVLPHENAALVFDTPTALVKGKNTYLVAEMGDLLEELVADDSHGTPKAHAFIEGQQTFPKMPSRAMFSLGYGYGLWLGLVAGLKIPHTIVPPKTWKAEMAIPRKADKEASRMRAQQLYPDLVQSYLTLKKHHGRAEALLIAEYGRRML